MNILSMDFLREGNTLLNRQSKEAGAEHTLPLRTMDHLIPLLEAIAPDSEIIKSLNCGLQESSKLLDKKISKTYIDDMKSNPFSLILDETTDVSTAESMAIVVRDSNN
ncbi:hypothetical protein JTB14_006948 [Gonioctena quinquepunctata]|nr:hypothetical protein JTB14_006948 [Gonioctena quinquepunctata]